ncbi:hypothetical protein C8R44DRAFT_750388 [Mycena epipterygia]|nr:hypothetical protein C8R44DRAFT_750388 [Mycena epipterygia]
MPFDSVLHRNDLMLTKEYTASSHFPSSFIFKKAPLGEILKEIVRGPPNPEGPADPDAILITIGVLSESKANISPLGNWDATNKFDKSINKAKYDFLINKPISDPVFAPDFPVTLAALEKIQTTISKSGKNLWLIVDDRGEKAIRFSFPVFQTKDKVENEDDAIDVRTLPTPSSSTYRDALQSIAETHVLREFIVFDTNNSRVDPEDIPTKLKPGALLECLIEQVVILRSAPPKTPSRINKSKPVRPPAMSPEQIQLQQQHLSLFTPQMPVAGPSNIPLPGGNASFPYYTITSKLTIFQDPSQKRKASIEPEGSDAKRVNTGEDKDKNKGSDSNTETSKDDSTSTESPHNAK